MGLSAEPPKDPFRTGHRGARACSATRPSARRWWSSPRTRTGSTRPRRRCSRSSRGGSRPTRSRCCHVTRDDPARLRGLPSRTLRAARRPTHAEALLHGLDPGPRARHPRSASSIRRRAIRSGSSELLAGAARAAEEPELPTWLPLSTRLERTFAARVADLPESDARGAAGRRADRPRRRHRGARRRRAARAARRWTSTRSRPRSRPGSSRSASCASRFGHPLMRSAIGQGGSESRRRAAHEALAQTLGARPARSLGHRVAAAAGTRTTTLADELAALAQARAAARLDGARGGDARPRGRAHGDDEHRTRRAAARRGGARARRRPRRPRGAPARRRRARSRSRPDDQQRRLWLQRTSSRRAPTPAWFEAHLDRVDELIAANDPARASQALLSVAFRAWWSDVPHALRGADDRRTPARSRPARRR